MINHRNIFLEHVAQTSQAPLALHITHASDCHLYDITGKSYIDLISGISVCNLGHNHPAIVKAIQEQSEKFLHVMVYGELIESPQTLLAHELCKFLPAGLNCTYFVNSGTEAVEGSLKLAKRFTGRHNIIAFKNAYHGSTQGSLSLMSDEYFTAAYRPLLPGITFLHATDPDVSQINSSTACVIIELVKAEEGCMVTQKESIQKIRKRCYETGTLLIVDECQTGMGRTGTLFAFEHYQIEPDILILGKAFGGGMPLGAFISSKKIMHCLTYNPLLGHLTTFGGHPLSCAAGLASLVNLTSGSLIKNVHNKELLFRSLLKHTKIRSIKGIGLLLGLEFESAIFTKKLIDGCIEKGLFTDWFLFAPNMLRIAPPLNIEDDLIKHSCEIILNTIEELS